jgi:Domain of unknown function(DUF2779)
MWPLISHICSAVASPSLLSGLRSDDAADPPLRRHTAYQTIPFQWSLHASDGDGVLHHREFLAEGDGDPRKLFTETLTEALVAFEGPICPASAPVRQI